MKNNMKINVAMELDKLLYAIADKDSFMGSDGIVNGQPAFQYDFTIDGQKMTVYLTN